MVVKRSVSRREFLKMAGVVTAGAALAACAPAATPTEAPAAATEAPAAEAPEPEAVTIVYGYHHTDADMLGHNQRLLLEKYDYKVPDTNIKVDLQLGYEISRAQADLAAGTATDVFWAGYQGLQEAIEEGLLTNVQDYMEAAGVNFDDFVDGIEMIYAPDILGGKFWGMPYEQVVVVWAYNPKVFEEAGLDMPPKNWTWNDAITIGTQVTRDKNGKHPDDPDFDINEVEVWGLGPWQAFGIQEYLPWTAGVNYVDETGTKATINNQGFYDSLQWLRDIYNTYHVATEKQPEKGLVTGALAIQETGNWALIDFWKQMGDVGCLYCPVHPVVKENATPWYDKELWIPAQEDKAREKAAYQFTEWWALGEPYLEYCLETGYFPFTKHHAADQRWKDAVKDKEFMQVAMEMPAFATRTRFWALFRGSDEAEKTMSELWDAAVHTEEDIWQLLERAEAEVQRIMDKYRE